MAFLKRGEVLNSVVLQIIFVALVLGLFLVSTAGKINGVGIKQQVLEKQMALLIDSAVPGMEFEVNKININGVISNVRLSNGKIFFDVDEKVSLNGYPYFTKYSVSVVDREDRFAILVR